MGTMGVQTEPNLERVAEILRQHGINAYVQGDTIMLFAASTSAWHFVARIWPQELDSYQQDTQVLASMLAARVAALVKGPHSHD